MDQTKARLGRGLNSLLGEAANGAQPAGPVSKLALNRIQFNPHQPRKRFDDDELHSLTQSVKTHGILQPLVVRPVGAEFQLIAGERRLRAAKAAGLAEVPVHIVNFNDQQVFEAALVENIQRSDLNPIEKAQGFKDYLDKFSMTQDQLGGRLGLDRTTISNLLGLLNLPKDVQDAVRLGQISLGHAKVLKGVSDPARQAALCKETIMRNYSVHALELLVKQQRSGGEPESAPAAVGRAVVEKTAHVQSIEDDLRRRLAVKVEIRLKAKDRGQVVIDFESFDDFERVIEALK